MTSTEQAPSRARSRLGVGAMVVIVLVALAVTVAIGMLRTTGTAEVLEPVAPTEGVEVAAAELYVHVSGAVTEPGLYRLAAGARVFDAVAAAGGLVDGADVDAVNLARPVSDGEQVRVPVIGETPPVAEGGAGPDGKIDLNTADAATLDELPRIGPAIAERIISWREQNGRFTSVDDLLAVPGIGDKMLAGLRDLVTV